MYTTAESSHEYQGVPAPNISRKLDVVNNLRWFGFKTIRSAASLATWIPSSLVGHIRQPLSNLRTTVVENAAYENEFATLEPDPEFNEYWQLIRDRVSSVLHRQPYVIPILLVVSSVMILVLPVFYYIIWALRYLLGTVTVLSVWLCFPRILGLALSKCVTHFALNGYPLKFEHIHVSFWISWARQRIYCRIAADGVGFGNPPNFPHKWFLTCGKVAVQGSMSLEGVSDILHLRYKTVPLRKNPYYQNIAILKISSIEFEKLMINFELWDGKFNINEFTSILAQGEVRKVIGKDAPMPNKLTVDVIRAKELVAKDVHRSGKSSDPKVIVKARNQRADSSTRIRSLNPIWGEELNLKVDDPSTVILVQVFDEDVASQELIGQWIITAKYLLIDPTYCWYDNSEAFEILKNPEGRVEGMKGWFPLSDKRMANRGKLGKVHLAVRWTYDSGYDCNDEAQANPRIAALEQLKQNSRETNLRLGNTEKVTQMLNAFPILFDISRVSIRDVEFYLQDLFRGYNGAAEVLKKQGREGESASFIRIDSLDWSKAFRPRAPDPGITVYGVLYRFFLKGVMPSVLSDSGVIGSAVSQTSAAIAHNLLHSMSSLFKGNYEGGFRQLGHFGASMGSEVKNVGKRVRTRLRVRAGDWDDVIDAEDLDFLQHPRLRSYFHKTSNRSRFSKFGSKALYVFELRGSIICYNRVPETGVHRKIRMDSLQCVVLDLPNLSLTLHRKEKRTVLQPSFATIIGHENSVDNSDSPTTVPPMHLNDVSRDHKKSIPKQVCEPQSLAIDVNTGQLVHDVDKHSPSNATSFDSRKEKTERPVGVMRKMIRTGKDRKGSVTRNLNPFSPRNGVHKVAPQTVLKLTPPSISSKITSIESAPRNTDQHRMRAEKELRTWFDEIKLFGVNHALIENK